MVWDILVICLELLMKRCQIQLTNLKTITSFSPGPYPNLLGLAVDESPVLDYVLLTKYSLGLVSELNQPIL